MWMPRKNLVWDAHLPSCETWLSLPNPRACSWLWFETLAALQREKLSFSIPWMQWPVRGVQLNRGQAEYQSAHLCKDGLGCILQNLLIKPVVKSFWHLRLFLAPSKVSLSSAADSNEKKKRHQITCCTAFVWVERDPGRPLPEWLWMWCFSRRVWRGSSLAKGVQISSTLKLC